MARFFSIPAWCLIDTKTPTTERLDPELPAAVSLEAVLAGIEYRGTNAYTHALTLLEKNAKHVVYARSPNDLPALLRTADQLITFTRRNPGEHALVRRCQCGARYAVPMSLVRPVTIRCENCKRIIDLDPTHDPGEFKDSETEVSDEDLGRKGLAEFFREAMARGWPVLVTAN